MLFAALERWWQASPEPLMRRGVAGTLQGPFEAPGMDPVYFLRLGSDRREAQAALFRGGILLLTSDWVVSSRRAATRCMARRARGRVKPSGGRVGRAAVSGCRPLPLLRPDSQPSSSGGEIVGPVGGLVANGQVDVVVFQFPPQAGDNTADRSAVRS